MTPSPPTSRLSRRRWLLGTIFALLVVSVAAPVAWNNGVRNRFFPKRWGVVVPGAIYRSGLIHPALMEPTLAAHQVREIVNLCGQDEWSGPETAAAQKLGIEVSYIAMPGDGVADAARYAQAVTRIIEARKAGKPVLVHCAAGTHRTGGVVATYRLLVEGAAPEAVLEEMKRYSWAPKRDARLREFLNQNLPEIARLLAAQGAIPKVPAQIPTL